MIDLNSVHFKTKTLVSNLALKETFNSLLSELRVVIKQNKLKENDEIHIQSLNRVINYINISNESKKFLLVIGERRNRIFTQGAMVVHISKYTKSNSLLLRKKGTYLLLELSASISPSLLKGVTKHSLLKEVYLVLAHEAYHLEQISRRNNVLCRAKYIPNRNLNDSSLEVLTNKMEPSAHAFSTILLFKINPKESLVVLGNFFRLKKYCKLAWYKYLKTLYLYAEQTETLEYLKQIMPHIHLLKIEEN